MSGPVGSSTKNEPEKLVNKHHLEAVDPQHRYGRNLRLYENVWKRCGENENFLTWLDSGEGRHVDLPECSRSELQRHRVRYLKTSEREEYEVVIKRGMLVYKRSGEFVETAGSSNWIYVVSPTKQLYVGEKQKGFFHHSSFLDGGDVLCAGYLEVSGGQLKVLSANSGHYKPEKENFQWFTGFLRKHEVNLEHVLISNAKILHYRSP